MQSDLKHSYALIMAGGAGTRLWPISRKSRPKQFQKLANDSSLLQHMVDLTLQVLPIERVFVMAIPDFADVIREQIPNLPEENLLFEPARRDNGPAINLGMLQIHQRDPKATVALLWSDHLIKEAEGYRQMLTASFEAALTHPSALVVMGTKPTAADTTLGYIQMSTEVGEFNGVAVFKVKQFIEKPDQETANRFVRSWEYLWNLGYKVVSTEQYLKTFDEVQPDLRQTMADLKKACKQDDWEKITTVYEQFPKLSIEYLYTPFVKELLVVPADIGWSDVGNWKSLHDITHEPADGYMVTRGKVVNVDSTSSLVFAADRPIVVAGVSNLVVVDDGDVILIMDKNKPQDIKKVVEMIEQDNPHLL